MIDIEAVSVGDRVHYQPSHYTKDQYKNGIIKDIRHYPDIVFVVYNCGGEWDRYKEYTAALTNVIDLHLGWRY